MRLASLFVAFLVTATSFSTAAAEPIKELNISYVKPPFVLQLLVMKDRQLLEKEFQADGIKINWHNMGTSPQAARAMSSGSLDIAGNMNTAALLMLNSEVSLSELLQEQLIRPQTSQLCLNQERNFLLKISKANKSSVRKVLSYISSSLPPWRKKA